MIWLQEYAPSSREHPRFLLSAYSMGGISAMFSLGLLLAGRGGVPSIWPSVGLGASVAGLCLVWGATHLLGETPVTRWGKWLRRRSPSWFPVFLFSANYLMGNTFFLLLWVSIIPMGWPSNWLTNILFVLLLGLAPLKRMLHSWRLAAPGLSSEIMDNLARAALVSVAILFAAATLSEVLPALERDGSDVNMRRLFAWLLAWVAVAMNVLLFLSQLPRHRTDPARATKAKAPHVQVRMPEQKKPVEY